jgi:hypothetical protein
MNPEFLLSEFVAVEFVRTPTREHDLYSVLKAHISLVHNLEKLSLKSRPNVVYPRHAHLSPVTALPDGIVALDTR